ncbi:MAG: glycosyltransferase family 2 protein [Candidatus Melainabacteria bacterium]
MFAILVLRQRWGFRHAQEVSEISPLPARELPALSVIAAACNEAAGIEAALQSLLHQDYPHFEIIIVNDRSTDETGAILQRMSLAHPQLKVITVESLPAGWLGKNHALWQAAKVATGEFLLFTDADIVFSRDALTRSVSYAIREQADHLAVFMGMVSHGLLFDAFLAFFVFSFNVKYAPWLASNPNKTNYIGIGGYNLVRRSAYEAIGTHEAIRMQVADDMKLGQRIKQAGLCQRFLFGTGTVVVDWYQTPMEAIRGLEKNAFLGSEESPVFLVLFCLITIGIILLPYALIWMPPGMISLTAGICVLVQWVFATLCIRGSGLHPLAGVGFPFGMLIMMIAILRSVWFTLRRGGIVWRGTFYPLKDLRG